MFITEYDVHLKGAMYMWLMVLAMIGFMALAVLLGLLVLVMIVLHRKPRGASSHDAWGTHAD